MAAAGDTAWQEHCTTTLLDCVRRARGGVERWERLRGALSKANRIIIADADLGGKSLRGYNLSYLYITRCHFRGADLRGCKIRSAIIRETNLDGVDLRGSTLTNTFIASSSSLRNPRYDDNTKFDFLQKELPAGVEGVFAERVQSDHKRNEMYRVAGRGLSRLWLSVTNYGRRIGPLLWVSAGAIAVFSIMYTFIGMATPSTFNGANWYDIWIYSTRVFLNIEPQLSPTGSLTAFFVTIEATLGLVQFAILISILTAKLLRAAD